MKRYVAELRNDIEKKLEKNYKAGYFTVEIYNIAFREIENTFLECDKGYITALEAAEIMIEVYKCIK